MPLTAEILAKAMGLDVPIHVQYGRWVTAAFQGDLGLTLWGRQSITELLAAKVPVSFELGLMAAIIAMLISIVSIEALE